MSTVFLIRHGQAGTRDRYDTLSEVGRRQARLLGEYFARLGVQFDLALSGSLQRQRETARETLTVAPPRSPLVIEPLWNEFDLDALYLALAPRLAQEDPVFLRESRLLQASMADSNHRIHREWTYCDTAVFRAWLEGRYPLDGESWADFTARVRAAFAALAQHPLAAGDGRKVAVFTSATPGALCVGTTLGLPERKALRLAGVWFNTAFSSIRWHQGEPMVYGFNHAPHLEQPELFTLR